MGDEETEPLATSRARRSNAGARMHQIIFSAEDEKLAPALAELLKPDDDSSDDGEYVPENLEPESDSGTSSDNEDVDDDNRSDSDQDDDNDDEDDNDQAVPDLSCIKKEGNFTPCDAAYESCKKICAVCLGEQSDEDNEIIECDLCGITVHESCYLGDDDDGQEEEDDDENDQTVRWFCEPCRRGVMKPHCELCPNLPGIYKLTDTGRWVHMVCALYTRGVTFENITNLSDVSLFELNYGLYGSKACAICEDRRLARSGICIGCDAGLCKTFFHATCAQKEGLLFESHSDEVDPYFAQCKQHADKTIIKKKKKLYAALHAKLKRSNPLIENSSRIEAELKELQAKKPDTTLTRWTPENRPPIPVKVSRMLMTSPSLIIRLNKKSELLGLDPKSSFMSIQDELETARQKWHIPPAFDLEFVAYCRDRTGRMLSMKKHNVELIRQNSALKEDEASLREKYNSIDSMVSDLRLDCTALIDEAKALQKIVTATSGKQYILPPEMEQLINESFSKKSGNNSHFARASKSATKTSTTHECGKCETVKDQHLLSLCDTCNCYFHIYCLDPPLTRVPKKTKFGGWQCSDCSEKDDEDQEEAEEEQQQQLMAEQEAEIPRRLRERIKFPEKYCHESMMMADFWSNVPKRKSKKSSKSKSKKHKVES